MNFATWAYRHSRFLLSLFVVFAIAGAACSLWLPVALFPQLSFPRIRIDLDAGDRPAERIGPFDPWSGNPQINDESGQR